MSTTGYSASHYESMVWRSLSVRMSAGRDSVRSLKQVGLVASVTLLEPELLMYY
ncbi:hypothetical protein [Nostoc sp.]|uniref:hypothetical protein n=1 Tax=Nostoc sp. TaxID=1180 RepID=UPI002FF46094